MKNILLVLSAIFWLCGLILIFTTDVEKSQFATPIHVGAALFLGGGCVFFSAFAVVRAIEKKDPESMT